jgi:hypothetical protein
MDCASGTSPARASTRAALSARCRAQHHDIRRDPKTTILPTDLSSQLKRQAGISLDSYVDLTFGALAIYLGRTPKDLIENAALAVLNPKTFFGNSVPPDVGETFWEMESCTISEFASMLSAHSELVPHQDFTAFRMKPFLRLDTGSVICVNLVSFRKS